MQVDSRGSSQAHAYECDGYVCNAYVCNAYVCDVPYLQVWGGYD